MRQHNENYSFLPQIICCVIYNKLNDVNSIFNMLYINRYSTIEAKEAAGIGYNGFHFQHEHSDE
jgi:hypothetical protein